MKRAGIGILRGEALSSAAVVGVTPEQEVLLRHLLLREEGLLAPLFRQGMPVLVADVRTFVPPWSASAIHSRQRYQTSGTGRCLQRCTWGGQRFAARSARTSPGAEFSRSACAY